MTSIWFKPYMLDMIQGVRNCNLAAHIGIDLTEIGPDYLKGVMPVDKRTTQPFGILHGGASCVLSESLGSVAAWMTIDPDLYRAVGLEINANHTRAVTEGFVIGTCSPLHIGRRTQVWQTDITEEATGKRVAISRLTVAVIEQGTLSAQKDKVIVGKA
ncbi:MAG: hotdog fold thioesterase [Alphaproteobacteria bacterium]|nr:hotdog fold thioesterase [Alphaproteobacteria bacterium]MCD8519719.1 hotdog fold thioesterase [Alphaproteobacteria bacterium]MCD8525721.1 hotdog fold thioesterase [Alphaproteobacteria bacterium]MCD8570710.1 hotdog fold thioesterase [Alphaproteobacteria bacterium]